jgi:hypothetical protein
MRTERFALALALVSFTSSAGAQWLDYPVAGTPLKKDGTVDLTAKTPRTLDGKPDLSGLWRIEPPKPGEIDRLYHPSEANAVAGDDWREFDRHFMNLFIDFKAEESPLSRTAIAQMQKLQQGGQLNAFDSPSSRCLPLGFLTHYFHFRPFKIFQAQQEIVMYFEVDGAFRQIHTDGRRLPQSPFPSWMGYSTGKWEGDSLVVDTAGFNDQWRLDAMGHPNSEELRIHEVFHRRDFGHLDIDATVEDPVMLTRPVNVRFSLQLIPNSDMLETYCAEGNLDQAFMRGQPK